MSRESRETIPREIADDIVRSTTRIQLAIALGLMLDAVDKRRGAKAVWQAASGVWRATVDGWRLARSLGLGRADASSAVRAGLREFGGTLGGAP